MNVFLFFYLFILFILLTPGTLITLSIGKLGAYSGLKEKWIVAAIHGFLFSAIATTTYSFVNDLYFSCVSPIKEGIETGFTFTSTTPGSKEFNTPSSTLPGKAPSQTNFGPNIKCGKHKFCGSADPSSKKVYCYGDSNGCLWGQNSCNTDADCQKYNENSAKYTDYVYSSSHICPNYKNGEWPAEFCISEGIAIKP